MDNQYIIDSVQKIINKSFKLTNKKRLKLFSDRVNFACPYCGDSHKDDTAKRGNIWYNSFMYVCFNCDKKTTFDRFMKDYNEMIDPVKKMEIIKHIEESVSFQDYENEFYETKISDLIEIDDLDELFNKKNITKIYDFKPVEKGTGIYKYLENRKITGKLQENIYQAKLNRGSERYEPLICLLNKRKNKVLSLQIRNLKSGKRRFFKIYNFETLYNWINEFKIMEDIPLTKMAAYNKLSYYFNILNIDYFKMITIFEGYLDSLFYPNSIGVVGVNTDLKFLETNNLDIQYFFDNDYTGNINSLKKINEGHSVFLWQKLFKTIIDRKNKDPLILYRKLNKVKDLNKLAQIVTNPYFKLKLNNYFSKDIYDKKFIPNFNKKILRRK